MSVPTERDQLHQRMHDKLEFAITRKGTCAVPVDLEDLCLIVKWLRPKKRPSPRSITSPENSNDT